MDAKTPLSVRDLRRLWKPHKERLQRASHEHPLVVRMHRAFSWMAAVENGSPATGVDEQLVSRWIALNALYGRWNPTENCPEPELQSLRQFLDRVCSWDRDELVPASLQRNQSTVIAICSDRFLNRHFWRILDTDDPFHPHRDRYAIERAFASRKWELVLRGLTDRIYLVRCQLVHGAATYNSERNRETSLNRQTVTDCGRMLEQLLFTFLTIIIQHGVTANWDGLCYPPVRDAD